MKNEFKDKVFIITGSTQGLGRTTAKIALQHGAKVVINGRNESRKDEVLKEHDTFKDTVLYVHGDVSKAEDAERIVSETIARFGKLDVLINNGGMSAFGDLETSNPTVIKEVIDSNITGSLLMAHYAIPHLKKTKGSIEFISSLAAIHGIGGYSLYSAAKMAYIGACQSLRKELKDAGVHVGILYLGFTKNDAIKRTLNPDGVLEKVPERKGFPVSTQEESATMILNQIKNRKATVVHSALGKLNFIMNRISPGLIHMILLKRYREQS